MVGGINVKWFFDLDEERTGLRFLLLRLRLLVIADDGWESVDDFGLASLNVCGNGTK